VLSRDLQEETVGIARDRASGDGAIAGFKYLACKDNKSRNIK
jgi:hypothetical protein